MNLLSLKYHGQKYVWNIFKSFTSHKHQIGIDMHNIDEYCANKGLLGILFSDKDKEKYSEYKYQNKNL